MYLEGHVQMHLIFETKTTIFKRKIYSENRKKKNTEQKKRKMVKNET